MTTGLILFHLVALTPTNLKLCPAPRSIAAFAEPESILSPECGYILIVADVSFSINASNPVDVSGSFTPSAEPAVAEVTILYVFVSAVAVPWLLPAPATAALVDNIEPPPTVNVDVVVTVAKDGLSPDSYLAVLRDVKLPSTSLLVSGLPFDDLKAVSYTHLTLPTKRIV